MTAVLASLSIIAGIAALLPVMFWIVRRAKSGAARRRVGGYAVMYALFFSFGKMFEGGADYVEVAQDPARKKRSVSGDPPDAGNDN